MNIRHMEAFLAVVEAGSIMGASARLNLTQPGVSRRIQTLEDALGVMLLDRQSKPLKPTPEGLQAYRCGRRIIGELESLLTDLSPQGEIVGECRLGVTPYLSGTALNAPLDVLRKAFPALSLSIVAGWPEQLLDRLRRGEMDAAAFCLPANMPPPSVFECHALGEEPLVIVAAKDTAFPPSVTLRDLSGFPWIMNQDGCALRSAMRRQFDQAGIDFRVVVEALDPGLRFSLVKRGLGLTVSTRRTLNESPHKSGLRSVEATDFQLSIVSVLVHRSTMGRLVGPVQLFKDAMSCEFEGKAE